MMDEPRVTLLLFTNGKIVCAGAKSEEDVLRAVAKLHRTLEAKGLMESTASLAEKHREEGKEKELILAESPASEEPSCLLAAASH
jgi:hypothetical protein